MAGCLGRIREACPSMTPKERHAAEYVLAHSTEVAAMSIEELAAASKSSTASILRMCRKAGLDGYRDFLRLLSSDVAIQQSGEFSFGEIQRGASLDEIVGNVIHNSIYALENTKAIIDQQELQRAVQLLCSARRIDFYGVGVSGYVAQDAYSKFLRIGTISMSSNNPHTQVLSAMSLTPEDAAVLISYSGETVDMLMLQEAIHARGTPIISLTRRGKNSLASKADIRLYATASEPLVRSGPMTSRLSQLAVLDILYLAVCTERYNEIKSLLDDSQLRVARMHMR